MSLGNEPFSDLTTDLRDSIKSAFSGASHQDQSRDYFSILSNDAQSTINQSTQPQGTMLSSLAPNLNTAVTVSTVNHVAQSQANSASQIQPAQAAATAVKNIAGMQAGAIASTIQAAQREVLQSQRDTGHAGANVFSGRQVSGSAGGLIAQATIQVVPSGLDTLLGDLANKTTGDRKQIIAEIQDRLISRASPTLSDQVQMPGAQQPTTQGSAFAWDTFFEKGHNLDDLMATDPNNPSPTLFPEIVQIQEIADVAERELDNLRNIKEEATVNHTIDPNYFAKVNDDRLDLSEIEKASVPNLGFQADREVTDIFNSLNAEPDPAELALNNESFGLKA